MELTMLILTGIGTIATIISTVIAVRAKNEVKRILNITKNNNNRNANNTGSIKVKNSGINMGEISGISTGDSSSYAE